MKQSNKQPSAAYLVHDGFILLLVDGDGGTVDPGVCTQVVQTDVCLPAREEQLPTGCPDM